MNKDIQIAKKTVQTEIKALKKLSLSFNQSSQFTKAVSLITRIKGKCLVVGVGKSYLVGLKIEYNSRKVLICFLLLAFCGENL